MLFHRDRGAVEEMSALELIHVNALTGTRRVCPCHGIGKAQATT